MVVKNQPSAMPDSYFELVKRFPLTHIRSLRHLGQAIALVDELLQKRLDRGAQEYLDALSDLIATYEDEHAPIPDASESDVLRELMRSSGHKQMALSKAVGISQSTTAPRPSRSSRRSSSMRSSGCSALPQTRNRQPRLPPPPACGSGPSPSCTASAPPSATTCICTPASPTASSCRLQLGRRATPRQPSCRPARSARPTWPPSPRKSAAA